MRKTAVKVLAPMLAFSLVAAACGGDDTADAPAEEPAAEEPAAEEPAAEEPAAEEPAAEEPADEVVEITVTGPERSDEEAGALQQVLGAWGEANGAVVTYTGDADWEANINVQVEAGNPPDISIFPQPGKLADFARAEYLVPLSDSTAAAIEWADAWQAFGNVDGVQFGVPVKSDLKSLVWYSPARFAADGYEVPTTFDEFVALVDEITAAGGSKALCVGIESGQATGWTFTDWVEDMVLRQSGPEVYDQWVAGEVMFSDEPIQTAMQTVIDLWTEDNVYASAGTIAATAFQDNGQPLVDGDCYMHRQASFYSAFIPEGTVFGDGEGEINVFYFPDINGDAPVLGAGTLAAAFNDSPKVMELLAYMGSAQYAMDRQTIQAELKGGNGALSGFLSAALGQDPAVYTPLEQSFLEILENAAIVRFDASDLMPADVGAGTFWTEGTSLVNGDIDVATAGANIDASWPS